MCSDAPPPPDFGPMAEAMKENTKAMTALGNKQLAFGQSQFEAQQPFYQRMVNANIEGQNLSMQLARDSAQDRQKYRALEDTMVSDAMNQDKSTYRNTLAGRAASDVEQATSTARASASRNLERMGINPNAARFADLNNQITLQSAATKAGAMTNARLSADNIVDAKRMNAISIGRNLPATQLSAIGTGSQVGNSNATLFNQQSVPMNQGFAGAMSGYANANQGQASIGNMMNQGYQNQLAAFNADNAGMNMLGQVVGAGAQMFMMSSEDYKKDKTPIKDGDALGAVRNMPVESWDYKTGIADGGSHVGPYAEDFKRETGLGNGRAIPMQDAIGLTMRAVQDLDRKIDALGLKGKAPKKMKNGGIVEGPGTGTSDSVNAENVDTGQPIRLSNGEYVLPEDTVRKVGKQALDKLVRETHTPVRKKAIRSTT